MEAGVMDESPRKWWQWFLLYPTLIIAIIGAVPQFYQWARAATAGVPISGVFSGGTNKYLETSEAYERNLACLTGREITRVKPQTQTSYSIELVPCPSGDILITLRSLINQDLQKSDWIITKDLFPRITLRSMGTVAQATSAPPSGGAVEIVDIKKQGSVLTKRVRLANNTCVDETVDTFTGRLLSRSAAPCSKF
jgi:hypothetical protein